MTFRVPETAKPGTQYSLEFNNYKIDDLVAMGSPDAYYGSITVTDSYAMPTEPPTPADPPKDEPTKPTEAQVRLHNIHTTKGFRHQTAHKAAL